MGPRFKVSSKRPEKQVIDLDINQSRYPLHYRCFFAHWEQILNLKCSSHFFVIQLAFLKGRVKIKLESVKGYVKSQGKSGNFKMENKWQPIGTHSSCCSRYTRYFQVP